MGKKKKVGKERIDKYYKLAKSAGFRARSAFKLIQIAQKYNIFKDANVLIDLCAAPGGWLQVAYKNMKKSSTIIGVDLDPIRKIDNNVITIRSDITTIDCIKKIRSIIKSEKADVILNDGAPNVGTTYSYDSFNQNVLVLSSIKIAYTFLKKGGIFITKVFRNEEYISLIWVLEKLFGEVKHVKPRSSREISSEIYLIALNFLNIKIESKLFDYTYIFSSKFKDDSTKKNSAQLSDGNATDSSKEEGDEKDGKEKKKKKGLSTILKLKAKKNRQGYNVGDDYRATDVCKFINSDNYVDLIIKNNKFTFDENYKNSTDPLVKNTYDAIYNNKSTTEEIFHLCKDLKVLGKSDLFHLLKWRYKIKKGIIKNEQQSLPTAEAESSLKLEQQRSDSKTSTKATLHEEELSSSSDEEDVDEAEVDEAEVDEAEVDEAEVDEAEVDKAEADEGDEINEFSKYIEKKEKREKKKKAKKLKKEQEKKRGNKSHKIDYDNDEVHFNKDMLKLLKKQKFEDHLDILTSSKNSDKLEINEGDNSSSENEEEANFNGNNNSKLQQLEYLVNLDYEKEKMKEKKKKEQKMNEENDTEKMTRRKRAMEFKNEELMKIQKIMELKNEEFMMKKKLKEYLSDNESVNNESGDDKDGSHLGEENESEEDYDEVEITPEKRHKYGKLLKQNEHIQKIVDKIIRIRKTVKEEEEEEGEAPNISRFFNQKIFSNIFSQLDAEMTNVEDAEGETELFEGNGVGRDDEKVEGNETENCEDIKEIDASKLPKIPLPEKLAKKERKKKLKEKYGNSELKMKNSTFSIVKTSESSQNVNEYFANLVKDEDELALIRYIGEKLIHKKSRMDLIDDSFNRNSCLEDAEILPNWFLEEEKIYRKPIIPIDKSVLDQYKSKINKITRMPIKKVIEAKMRNKKREIKKMKKLEAKIGKIEKDETDPFLKQKAITNILRKNKSEKKREKSYVVCTSRGSKIAKGKNKKGGKTKVTFVDKRLKKDKKAKRRIEKRKKNAPRVKYSKSNPFKFRKKI
ncbi:large subunit rRNA methyltransferase, putative [Plasmodium ovale curtisi]|uniref:Putative rRNA methyltransferase n=1 Tax=Plasmodium ovale curtisi TaxID=864141 RepID=A0A1A8WNQ5_PLAOA|nr:large subunit rRNA methyltransferase, putative [Plasmodium ovale curtisi]